MGFVDWGAFFQALTLGLLGFYLTWIVKPNIREFTFFDALFPIGIALTVYLQNGLAGFWGFRQLPSRNAERPLLVRSPRMGPNSTLEYISGDPIHIGGGDIVVALTWRTSCEECKKSLPQLISTYKRFKHDAKFVAISKEGPDEIKEFLDDRSTRVPFICASDKFGDVTERLEKPHEVFSVPHVYIVGGTGNVEWHGHPAQLEPALTAVVRRLGAEE